MQSTSMEAFKKLLEKSKKCGVLLPTWCSVWNSMFLEVFSNLSVSMILFYDLLSLFLNSYHKSCQGSIFCLLLISKLYLQRSAWPPFSAFMSNMRRRRLTKNEDFVFLKLSWFLKQVFVAAIPTPPILQRQTCCYLLWTFHTCWPSSLLSHQYIPCTSLVVLAQYQLLCK